MNRQLPVYEITIDENIEAESEVNFVALVDRPAIQKDFMAFSEQKALSFAVNEDRRIISGPLMLADHPIYRNFDGEECYVIFSKDTIEKIAVKFFKKSYQSNVNLQHDDALQMEGVTMFESFMVDKSRGIQPMKGYEDAADGSWFGSFKVENDAAWQLVKQGKVKGFSVEGIFGLSPQKMAAQEAEEKTLARIIDILSKVDPAA